MSEQLEPVCAEVPPPSDASRDMSGPSCSELPPPSAPMLVAAPGEFTCEICSANFATKRGLATHMTFAHRAPHPLSVAVHGIQCVACLMLMHTRSRLLALLRNRQACFAAITGNMPAPPPELDESLRKEERHAIRQARVHASGPTNTTLYPALRLHGPLPRWAPEECQVSGRRRKVS